MFGLVPAFSLLARLWALEKQASHLQFTAAESQLPFEGTRDTQEGTEPILRSPRSLR